QIIIPISYMVAQRLSLRVAQSIILWVEDSFPAQRNPIFDVPRNPLSDRLVRSAGLLPAFPVLVEIKNHILLAAFRLENARHDHPPSSEKTPSGMIAIVSGILNNATVI